MEFMNRSAQQAPRPAQSSAASASSGGGGASKKSWKGSPMWLRVAWIVLLFGATVLLVSLVALLYFGGTKEQNYLDENKNQAVFLTNGQVYFGKIKAVNKQYIDLRDIYYLNVSQQVQPDQKKDNAQQSSSVSLVKLGCELHGPVDQMIVNREQVTFWENLKSDGQVSDAIKKWKDQNPQGQKCNANATTTP
jgi:hypothetical protein